MRKCVEGRAIFEFLLYSAECCGIMLTEHYVTTTDSIDGHHGETVGTEGRS